MPPNSESKTILAQPTNFRKDTKQELRDGSELFSSLGIKQYDHRTDHFLVSGDIWLDDRKKIDNTKGLWRVHNNLYDLTDFVDKHPGGSHWFNLTKGTDITEAFESHHISEKPEKVLKKYFVEKAFHARNSPFTFEENGFYKTLKKNVREVLLTVPKSASIIPKVFMDLLIMSYVGTAVLAAVYGNYYIATFSGLLLSMLTTGAHNYIHQKDSFRMHYFNMSFMSVRDWRISHALSHHMFPNTIIDMEINLCEPLLPYLPTKKRFVYRYFSWIYSPLFYMALFPIHFVRRVVKVVMGETRHLALTDLVPFIVPALMYAFGGQTLGKTLLLWIFIVLMGSMHFTFNGVNFTHHGPEIFHDGDEPRTKPTIDWGFYQLDTVIDSNYIKKSVFMAMTHFGDHALHHLFPALDHGVLNYLYPAVDKTCAQFGIELRKKSQIEMVKEQFRQVARQEPTKVPLGKKNQ